MKGQLKTEQPVSNEAERHCPARAAKQVYVTAQGHRVGLGRLTGTPRLGPDASREDTATGRWYAGHRLLRPQLTELSKS